MTVTMIENETDLFSTPLTTEHPDHAAHIVFVPPEVSMTAAAYVLTARIYGTPIEALCGYRWIPWQDPLSLPVCESCLTEWNGIGGEGTPDA